MIDAVIFDLDGLMVDTEPLQSKAWVALLHKLGKKPVLNETGLVHTVGVGIRENWCMLKEKYGLAEDIEVLESRRSLIYAELLVNAKSMPGLFELLDELKKHPVKLGIASSSKKSYIDGVLAHLGIGNCFDAVVSTQEVEHNKPNPDVYLLCAQRLGVKPENCIVLEDSKSGVLAAYRAGMKFIAVPSRYTMHDFAGQNTLNSLMISFDALQAEYNKPVPDYITAW